MIKFSKDRVRLAHCVVRYEFHRLPSHLHLGCNRVNPMIHGTSNRSDSITCCVLLIHCNHYHHHHHHNRFMAIFPRLPGGAVARRELLDFVLQGKINRGRH